MAEIEANDGFCGQICGRISEMTTRIFWLKNRYQRGREEGSKNIYGQIWGQQGRERPCICGERGGISQINKIYVK